MASTINIFNHALSRIGIDQPMADPNENTKAGVLYRIWYDVCRQRTLRDGLWNFALRVVPLALLDGNTMPGWGYKYALPVDCLRAMAVTDQNGLRTTLMSYSPWYYWTNNSIPPIPNPATPFVIMDEQLVSGSNTSVRRTLNTDMVNAYLYYVADITDTNQFDTDFLSALGWCIASEIASPYLGAPTGPQVATNAAKAYLSALATAKANTLNEMGADIRPPSPAIAIRE